MGNRSVWLQAGEFFLILGALTILFHQITDVYGAAYHARLPVILLGGWLGARGFSALKKEHRLWFPLMTLGIVAAALILFAAGRPPITYGQGLELAASAGYRDLREMPERSVISLTLESSRQVPEAYLYGGEKDAQQWYVLVSPLSGQLEVHLSGQDTYIDRFLEMMEH